MDDYHTVKPFDGISTAEQSCSLHYLLTGRMDDYQTVKPFDGISTAEQSCSLYHLLTGRMDDYHTVKPFDGISTAEQSCSLHYLLTGRMDDYQTVKHFDGIITAQQSCSLHNLLTGRMDDYQTVKPFQVQVLYFSIYITITNMEGWVLKHCCCNPETRTSTHPTHIHTFTHTYTLCQLHWTRIVRICIKIYNKRVEVNNVNTIQTMRDNAYMKY